MSEPYYYLQVDDRDAFRVADDSESLRALFMLIEQRTGIRREAADLLMAQGMLICGKELVAGPDKDWAGCDCEQCAEQGGQ